MEGEHPARGIGDRICGEGRPGELHHAALERKLAVELATLEELQPRCRRPVIGWLLEPEQLEATDAIVAQDRTLNGVEVGGRTLIWDVHGDYKVAGLELRVLIAGAGVDDVAELNELRFTH